MRANTTIPKSQFMIDLRQLTDGMQFMDMARCPKCSGYGWNNKQYHHRADRDQRFDEVCDSCAGRGYKDDLNLTDFVS